MADNDFINQLPPDLRNMIGKTIQRKLPDGRIIKFVVGDVTGDGKVDDDDIVILRALCEGGPTAETLFARLTPEQIAACDINNDGFINRNDLLELCKKIVMHTSKAPDQNKINDLRNKLKK